MTQKQNSQSASLPEGVEITRRRLGLRWKIIGGLVAGVVLFGVVGLALVTCEMSRVMRQQLDRRAVDIATNLGDAAASYILKGNVLELYALATKYSLLSGVAYIVVLDGKGKVLAHSPGVSPPELRDSLTSLDQVLAHQRETVFRGKEVYETRVPILQGRAGSVHLAIWMDTVDNEIRNAILPIMGLTASALIAVACFSFLITQRMIRRIRQLNEVAAKVSLGDLSRPVGIESNDEIGDLAQSLERLRSSLQAAMVRLKRA
jgi:HAMP domain-containing protein